MKKSLYFLFLICFLSSCGLPYVRKYKLTEEDLEWVANFKTGDTCYFSDGMKRDTLSVKKIYDWNPRNTFPFDFEGMAWMEGNNENQGGVCVVFYLRHDNEKFRLAYDIRKYDNSKPFVDKFSFAQYFNYYEEDRKRDHVVKIGNHEYDNCYIIKSCEMKIKKDPTVLSNVGILPLTQFIWNKEKGLLQYTLNGNDVYTLVEE